LRKRTSDVEFEPLFCCIKYHEAKINTYKNYLGCPLCSLKAFVAHRYRQGELAESIIRVGLHRGLNLNKHT